MSRADDRKGLSDGSFEREAERLLRQAAGELDAATQSRLNRARQRALEEYDRQRRRPPWVGPLWRPVIGTAAMAIVALGLWMGRGPGPAPAPTVAAPAVEQAVDLEVLLADENMDLIEDLDFYDWLESEAAAEGGLDPELTG